jgi:hypothetical protein
MNRETAPQERWIVTILVALVLLSYARIYGLRDSYGDDNCWLLSIYIGDSLQDFLDSGFGEMRREGLGMLLYAFFLPFRHFENPYPLWYSVILAVQVAIPLVWYALVRNLSGDRWLAAFAATALIVFPLDHTLPYLTAFVYRAGLLLGLSSLYLTEVAARRGSPGWQLPAAWLLAVFTGGFVTEAIVAFEPARLLLLWHRLHGNKPALRAALRDVTRWWAPFAIAAALFAVHKMILKPYGMYSGMYAIGWAHFLDTEALYETLTLFALGGWRSLRTLGAYSQPLTPILGCIAAVIALVWLGRMKGGGPRRAPSETGATPVLIVGLLGFGLLLPELLLFYLAGRLPKLGFDSTHAALMQPGFAALAGLVAYLAARCALSWGRATFWSVNVMLAASVGLGIYFNNLNLDMFAAATSQENRFWQAFQRRFPALPPRAEFLIDAAPTPYTANTHSYYAWEDLNNAFDLELRLNRLYPPAAHERPARRYRVYDVEEMRKDLSHKGEPLFAGGKVYRLTHFGGGEFLDPSAMTVIRYRNGELLVNREIVQADASVPYRPWAEKPLPPWIRD